ncbi:DUF1924 domain-containing protein [Thiorhodococcus mannitoliphagus]|uniref:DUF1924 domain-containing protein n=1 Tax=Thiorhodococcus mannitoliphagus TaxID=329406 RepID=A0A6P1DQ70_9GAMM|nr:DUF1924 domain-containing protein [Thiorhodococcus mannitoliphagus]NEX20168.1 DUF1924 domain-containing protein [Thiorhodococcus mannitoliphagus]
MKTRILTLVIAASAAALPTTLLAADAAAGKAGWVKEYPQADGSPARSCATCHGTDLKQSGKHAKTGKVIEPMAPSVNPQRLSDEKKIAKWLLRNCKWTLGRECSAEEKADFLAYIKTQ